MNVKNEIRLLKFLVFDVDPRSSKISERTRTVVNQSFPMYKLLRYTYVIRWHPTKVFVLIVDDSQPFATCLNNYSTFKWWSTYFTFSSLYVEYSYKASHQVRDLGEFFRNHGMIVIEFLLLHWYEVCHHYRSWPSQFKNSRTSASLTANEGST